MDTENPVVQLCIQGMQAEGEGRPADARDLCPFYASLHLNLGRCAEEAGELAGARAHYQRAAEALPYVTAGPYRELLARGVHAALERTAG